MQIKCESCVFSAALMVGLAAVAYGQSPDVAAGSLASEVTALKTDNIALREQLNKVEQQQEMLLEVVKDLKQQLGRLRLRQQETLHLPHNRTLLPRAACNGGEQSPRSARPSRAAEIRFRTTGNRESLSRWNHNLGCSRKR